MINISEACGIINNNFSDEKQRLGKSPLCGICDFSNSKHSCVRKVEGKVGNPFTAEDKTRLCNVLCGYFVLNGFYNVSQKPTGQSIQ